MEEAKGNLIMQLTFQFGLGIISFTEHLESLRKYNLVKQLFKSGTSVGANVREALGCESKADSIHKMKVAYKEAEETKYWLKLCIDSATYSDPGKLVDDVISILKVLWKIISSSKK